MVVEGGEDRGDSWGSVCVCVCVCECAFLEYLVEITFLLLQKKETVRNILLR